MKKNGKTRNLALLFSRNFLKHPRMLGAISPSSSFLVQRLLQQVDWQRAEVLVEYGPGVGTFTREILRRMKRSARLLVIETNADFVHVLQGITDPRLIVVHGSAADVQQELHTRGLERADYVISGIPFSTLPPEVREATLQATASVLPPPGRFLVYQYSRYLLPELRRRFGTVHEELEWRNLVPARLFYCESMPTPPSR